LTHGIGFFEKRSGERLEFRLHLAPALIRDVSLFPGLEHFVSHLGHGGIQVSLLDQNSSRNQIQMVFQQGLKLSYAFPGSFQVVSCVLQVIVESGLMVDGVDKFGTQHGNLIAEIGVVSRVSRG